MFLIGIIAFTLSIKLLLLHNEAQSILGFFLCNWMVTEKSEAEQPLFKKFLSLLLAGALIHHERLMLEMEKEVSDCLEFLWILIYSCFIIFSCTQFKHPNVLIRDAWILFVSGIVPETELEWVHVQKPFNVLKSFKLFIFFVYFYTFWEYKKVVIIYFSHYIVEVDNLTSLPTILTIIYQWRLLQKDRCLVIFNHEFHHNVMGFHCLRTFVICCNNKRIRGSSISNLLILFFGHVRI